MRAPFSLCVLPYKNNWHRMATQHLSGALLRQLVHPVAQQSAFQANLAPPDRRRVVRDDEGHTFLQEACAHVERVYDAPENVPICVCERCMSLVVPETAHSVVARAVPLPHSMLRDERWQQLLQMYNEHWHVKSDVQKMLNKHEALLVRLHRWREAYTRTHALVDYRAQHNPMYRTLEDSIKRVANVVTGFQQTIDAMLVETRRKLLREVHRCVPRRQDDFVRVTKRLIAETRRAPLYHPNAGTKCTLCDEAHCFVMLHSPSRDLQISESARLRAELFGSADIPSNANSSSATQQTSSTERPCSCREFSVCIDCLLKWYWESSQALTKTFAQCPLCRADFQLEDIVPIFDGRQTASQSAAAPQERPEQRSQRQSEERPDAAAVDADAVSSENAIASTLLSPNALNLLQQTLGDTIEIDWSDVNVEDRPYVLFHMNLDLGASGDSEPTSVSDAAEEHGSQTESSGANAESETNLEGNRTDSGEQSAANIT